jgi:hypothetical protein
MAEAAAAARADEVNGTTEEELKAKLAATQGELAAERAARSTAENSAAAERGGRFAAAEQAIDNGIVAETTKLAQAKKDYAAAVVAGEGEKAADAQELIAEAVSELKALKWQKGQITEAKKAPVQRQQPTDQFERAIAGYSDQGKTWMRAHPEYVTDERKNAAAVSAHWSAVAEGIQADTPAYWQHVEKTLGLKKAPNGSPPRKEGGSQERVATDEQTHDVDLSEFGFDEDGDTQVSDQQERQASFAGRSDRGEPVTPEARRADEQMNAGRRASASRDNPAVSRERTTSTGAPPSRGTPTGSRATRPGTRQPTAGEIEAAKISFPDEWKESPKKALESYFSNKAALQREGRI